MIFKVIPIDSSFYQFKSLKTDKYLAVQGTAQTQSIYWTEDKNNISTHWGIMKAYDDSRSGLKNLEILKDNEDKYQIITCPNYIEVRNVSANSGLIKVYDMTGRCVYSNTIVGREVINMSLKSGIYVIIYIEDNKIYTQKVWI